MTNVDTVADVIQLLLVRNNEVLALLREIVARRREFVQASERGAASEVQAAAEDCHAAITAAERFLERV
jgi:hypothetical protein